VTGIFQSDMCSEGSQQSCLVHSICNCRSTNAQIIVVSQSMSTDWYKLWWWCLVSYRQFNYSCFPSLGAWSTNHPIPEHTLLKLPCCGMNKRCNSRYVVFWE
jgi:hypothetical protein